MIQTIIVVLLVSGSVLYLGSRAYSSARGKKKGCEKCAANPIKQTN